ncbi:HlyD family secretion protein [Caulobacter sp. UNC279MFTsu5.1]|uniref:HlyD family secretion protein n=1 Tax=Caulobacter sp. UNC279MFTsu5.1 TaxID=1502775 RepID=UPI0008E2874C|nr:HlyD family secretion protein [Caulobacter sp. UNC279MFTsu5.1]SFJ87326.1 Multidrug resistance efflux pump [Caulobacter sp. UNC279MFTsu5.1]
MTDAPSPAPQSAPKSAPQPEDRAAAAAPPPARPEPPTTRAILLTVGGAVVLVLVILFLWKLPPFAGSVQRTDNAYVRGQVTLVAPQLSGYVVKVLAQDFQTVRAGQPLFEIDQRIYAQRLDQARATLAAREADLANSVQARASREAALHSREADIGSAQAQVERARADMARVAELATDGSVSLRERDQARATLRAAEATLASARAGQEIARQDVRSVGVSRQGLEAAVAAAEAALRLAEIDMVNTVVAAPADGQLGQVGVRRGQYVTAGSQLVALVPPQRWVIANFKERQSGRMRPGQKATVTVDALGDQRFTGRVEQVSPATGSEFSILPAQNATGNFTKIAQRLPVRIALDPGQPDLVRLRPGMSVEAEVDTATKGRR